MRNAPLRSVTSRRPSGRKAIAHGDGTRFLRGQIEDVPLPAFALHPVGAAAWGGWLWLHGTPDQAEPLLEAIGAPLHRRDVVAPDGSPQGRRVAGGRR